MFCMVDAGDGAGDGGTQADISAAAPQDARDTPGHRDSPSATGLGNSTSIPWTKMCKDPHEHA